MFLKIADRIGDESVSLGKGFINVEVRGFSLYLFVVFGVLTNT